MKDEFEVTPALANLFVSGIEQQDFSGARELIKGKRTDSFEIYLTHDVDWLSPAHPYSVLKYLYSLINAKYKWYPLAIIRQKDSLLKNIERLIHLEQKRGISSVFFTGAGKHTLGRHDIRYNIHHDLFTELISLLNTFRHTVGLHSSYDACEKNRIGNEKKTLEVFTGKKVTTHRSHFLHYHPEQLYVQLEQSGIQYDFGYGKARAVGFSNSFPGKFRPVNMFTQKVYNVTCIPLMLMDNAFFFLSYTDVMSQFRSALLELKRYNGSACILFHPENMLLKPELWHYYEEIIDICQQEGANINPHLNRL